MRVRLFNNNEYDAIKDYVLDSRIADIQIADHMMGFDDTYHCQLLDDVATVRESPLRIGTEYIFPQAVLDAYPNLNFYFDKKTHVKLLSELRRYNIHPKVNIKNFVCSFNGSTHVSRKLLVSMLHKFGYFNAEYISKNFTYTVDELDGHIMDYAEGQENLYRKFFISKDEANFAKTINSFGHNRFNHGANIYNLENKLTESFLHIVSETMATSYVPFYGEKFLYSVVTRSLFLAYANPGWHNHLEKCYGFKKYTKLFDYRFDAIRNPVDRLIELISMTSKFSCMSTDDWRDLYEMEHDTIEYNYDHYFSGDYIKFLEKYE